MKKRKKNINKPFLLKDTFTRKVEITQKQALKKAHKF